MLALSWILSLFISSLKKSLFFILRRFTQISDESGKTFFDRKSVFF